MEENNQIIEAKPLNFFQRIRKSLLLRNITREKFQKAPEYLKNDEEVISLLLTRNPYAISELTMPQKVKMAEQIPTLLGNIPNNERLAIVSANPQSIATLEEWQAFDIVLGSSKIDLIKYLPQESQIKLLTEEIPYNTENMFISLNRSGRVTSNPNNFTNDLDKFAPEAVLEAVKILLEQAKGKTGLRDWESQKRSVPLLTRMNIRKLPVDTQIQIAALDNDFLKELSEDAVKEYVGTNPLLLKKMNSKAKLAFVKEHPEYFSILSWNEQSTFVKEDYELKNLIPEEERMRLSYFIYDKKLTKDVELVKRKIISPRYRDISGYAELTDFVREPETLAEVARFEPVILSTWGADNFKGYRKLEHTFKLYNELAQNPDIAQALEAYKNKFLQTDVVQRNHETENLAKILLNRNIMARTNPNLIVEFIKNQNIETFKNIIAETYGEGTRKIFEDRPNLTMDQIHNLDIFDPIVIEKIGLGTVHNLFSYNSFAPAIVGDLVRHPEKMQNFDKFSEITKDYFPAAPLDFENKVVAFKLMENLISNIRLEDITPERKAEILQIINDRNMTQGKNETCLIEVNTVQDLDTYTQRRNAVYDEYVQKVTTAQDVKEAITRKFFGLEYGARLEERYEQTVLTARGVLNYYNLENFASDERTQESGMFTNDELDQIELLNIINKVDDPNVLKQIYEELSSRQDVLSPVDFRQIRTKIPMQYSQELVSKLTTFEQAKQRAQNGEQGILYEQTEDGVDIVKLTGADFKLLIHTLGMNNSNLQVPYGADTEELWKKFENGCSTISGCVIEPEMLKSCAMEGKTNFGFVSMSPKQIVGMSHHDAHVTHGLRDIDPHFDFYSVKFNYSDELIRRTAAQITGQETKDQSHEYNEVAMYRRNVETSEITEGTYGGKIMPDYIVVYGTEASKAQMELAKKMGKDDKPIPIILIDTKAYGDRTYMRGSEYRKEDHSKPRENGEMLKSIKSIADTLDER